MLNRTSDESLPQPFGDVSGAVPGARLTREQTERSAARYTTFRDQQDEAVKIGLYGEDLSAAYENPSSILLEYKAAREGEGSSFSPLLVPAKDLAWYNMDLLNRTYGFGKDFYYYAHPPVPDSPQSQAIIAAVLQEMMDRGAIIFTDHYISQAGGILEDIVSSIDSHYRLDNLGGGDIQRAGEVFVGSVNFEGVNAIREAPSLYEVYRECIERGEIRADPHNGVALAAIIEGEEAEEIWQIYETPFDELTKEHPMNAGFTKEQLLGLLANPAVTKIVHRVNSAITTMCLLVYDFDYCPWFNRQYYKRWYSEYYDSNNIAIFPGIVSDNKVRGKSYSLRLLSLASRLGARRGSNILITFECTETSGAYIPAVVALGINRGGWGKVESMADPISVTTYKVLRRV